MTPDQYINKAIHAINTDQPNLAMLYMRRGIEVSKEARWAVMADTGPFPAFTAALEKCGEVFSQVTAQLEKVFASWTQDDFALVPARCTCTAQGGDDCECNCHNWVGSL